MFDSHAHVGFSLFDEDRSEVIARARQAGLWGWLEVGTDLDSSVAACRLAKEQGVWASAGVHPSDIEGLSEKDWAQLAELLDLGVAVAVGEVGFDFYRGGEESVQRPVVEKFIELAQDKELPMVWHVRDGDGVSAHEALLKVLGELSDEDRPGGVIHTFSGSFEQAQRYLDLGLYLSFSGVVTFAKAGEAVDVAKTVSLDRMLIETDCPFLAPVPFRGKRNEPSYVRYVAEKIAALRGISVDEVEKATDENARRFFRV